MKQKQTETRLFRVSWSTVFEEWFNWAMIAGLFLLVGWWIPTAWMVGPNTASDPAALNYPAFYDWVLIAIGAAASCAVVAALQAQRRSLRARQGCELVKWAAMTGASAAMAPAVFIGLHTQTTLGWAIVVTPILCGGLTAEGVRRWRTQLRHAASARA